MVKSNYGKYQVGSRKNFFSEQNSSKEWSKSNQRSINNKYSDNISSFTHTQSTVFANKDKPYLTKNNLSEAQKRKNSYVGIHETNKMS